ncbi:dihydrolipoyl dehydrogenase [Lutispora saccharofermentans]|uniref:Dihydrolipoyl dehydrogenase n=1 Tax=Lutispora saccharofermentans TaxID=3024236 RepID=A0ABT1NDJ5_9FIRM|nr:dihydrolipoyl dehydrogenase [Lutispora saccharofermentans]MCQ1529319.1 dihydrolipoyl dehydrogenase [Lutispora saccharofermentans]
MSGKSVVDIAVLGGGPGGYASALAAARLKASVTLVEYETLGGTCLNVGCIPTKALNRCAQAYQDTIKAGMYGVHADNVKLDFQKAMKFKNQTVNQLTGGVQYLLNANKVNILKGKGRLISNSSILVTKDDGSTEEVVAKNIIIATGSKEIEIHGFPIDGRNVINSTHALALSELPKKLAIIGGGVIGVEFASIFRRMGAEVSIVELSPSLIPNEDEETREALKWSLEENGIRIYTNCVAQSYEKCGIDGGMSLKIEQKDGSHVKIECDKILVCVGRKASVEEIGFSELGGDIKKGRIVTDNSMKTNLDGVYAVGDVTMSEQLAHVAYQEARTAVLNIMGKAYEIDYSAVPHCIYSSPEIGSVGMNEQLARKICSGAAVAKSSFQGNGKALIEGQGDGYVKVIYNKEDGRILGGSILGSKATELIAQLALAVNKKLSVMDVIKTIHAHPTLSEAVGEACLAAIGLELHG